MNYLLGLAQDNDRGRGTINPPYVARRDRVPTAREKIGRTHAQGVLTFRQGIKCHRIPRRNPRREKIELILERAARLRHRAVAQALEFKARLRETNEIMRVCY